MRDTNNIIASALATMRYKAFRAMLYLLIHAVGKQTPRFRPDNASTQLYLRIFLILYGKIREIDGFLDFASKLSWELLNRLKVMPWDVGAFSTIENPIPRTFIFSIFFGQI